MPSKSPDITIYGAGVFGLQLARQALLKGCSVCVLEKKQIGAGASGGVLGALMPHWPDRWDPKVQFQLDALLALKDECAHLEDQTGLATGYGRIGRLMPIKAEHLIGVSQQRIDAAQAKWSAHGHFIERREVDPNWLDPEVTKFGGLFDSLAARLSPQKYLAALQKFVLEHPNAQIVEGFSAPIQKDIASRNGQKVIATGFEAFDQLRDISGDDLGQGIKGQSRLLKLKMPDDMPIIYDDGCYIVPHNDGTIAIGSTAMKQWQNATKIDENAWGFFDKAMALCPAIRQAPIIQEWANVRPKSYKRDPVIGRYPALKDTWLFTGGFKISFGIAHWAAKALMDQITKDTAKIMLPETLTSEYHFAQAQLKKQAENKM